MDTAHYHLTLPAADHWPDATVATLYARVFRTEFSQPGFALVTLPEATSSRELRAAMVTLKSALDAHLHRATGEHLTVQSMGRFDSQVTTKFHLDGAPDEAVLTIGYEASAVQSVVSIADYTRAAHDWSITPAQLLAERNPMFADHEKRLVPYITRLTAFDPARSHILLLNNSSLPHAPTAGHRLGVMHQATITPNPQAQRVINSMMLAIAKDQADRISAADQHRFLATDEIFGAL